MHSVCEQVTQETSAHAGCPIAFCTAGEIGLEILTIMCMCYLYRNHSSSIIVVSLCIVFFSFVSVGSLVTQAVNIFFYYVVLANNCKIYISTYVVLINFLLA